MYDCVNKNVYWCVFVCSLYELCLGVFSVRCVSVHFVCMWEFRCVCESMVFVCKCVFGERLGEKRIGKDWKRT